MAIERIRRVGAYAPLSATYYQDDAIANAGEAAELLYLRGLAFCAGRMDAEGFISDIQLTRFVGVGMTDAVDRAKALVEVGLWERVEGGYIIRSWLKWNKSASEMEAYRAKDRKRKTVKADKDTESDEQSEPRSAPSSERNPSGIRAEQVADSEHDSDTHYTSLHVTKNQEPPSTATQSRASSPQLGSDKDPGFTAFWTAYPLKRDKGHARKAWAKAIRGGTDPDEVVAAAQRYRDDPDRKRDFTAYPATWLNGERWNDAASVSDSEDGGWWNN